MRDVLERWKIVGLNRKLQVHRVLGESPLAELVWF
jgi:hypothetical protein